ncbi:WD40 repeat protein [Klebsormidium nitens]|uniref:WD40 repeat protein n=1 Tax=Klebsormidium nitens TaxID=105231 RepID=A0A1Y1ISZ9_KLENI|nr:WD40 repeat protein [Klebsormidium nitens]|eukprot:GAQ91308.1 WD40 repeat protein [Klebsormidium nitens]
MNLTLHNPSYSNEGFVLDFPEVIEEYLYQEPYYAQCVAFNRRGTLLAAGCTNGSILVWDFDTRGVAKELRIDGEPFWISSVGWSKDGRRLVSSTVQNNLISLWDVASGARVASYKCEYTILRVSLHPKDSAMCLVCPQQGPPLLLDNFGVSGEEARCGPLLSVDEITAGGAGKGKGGEGVSVSFGAAVFNKRGDLVFVGTARGEVLVVETASKKVLGRMQIQGGQLVRQIVVSRNGQYLMTNSSDRTLRIFKVELPVEGAAAAAAERGAAQQAEASLAGAPPRKKLANPFFTYICDHKDPINNVPWMTACFSGDTEYVMGASAQQGEHKLILWGTTYPQIMRTLDGPKEGVRDMAWHPTRPIVASVATTGVIYVWAKEYQENWSAFAPDFKELQENDEYDEREDEFDSNPREDEAPKGQKDVDSDIDLDIETVEKVGAYSDSDEDGLYFLPVKPEPDPPETEAPAVAEDDAAGAAARTVEAPGPSNRLADAGFDADGLGGRRKRKAKVHPGEEAALVSGGQPKSKKGAGKGGGGTKVGLGNGKKAGKGSKLKGKKKGGLNEVGMGGDAGFGGQGLEHGEGVYGDEGNADDFAEYS